MSYIGNSPAFQVAEGSVAGNLNVSGNVTITGNATINGTTNSVGALTENGNAALVVDKTSQPLDISSSAANSSIKIDSSGRSFRGNIPYIQLLHDSSTTYAAGGTITQWRTYSGNGITHTPLGVLNVPVAGLYKVGMHLINQGNSGVYIRINNVRQFRLGYGNQASGETWSMNSGDAIIPLSANDNVRLESEGNVNYYGDSGSATVSSFYLYLIG
jgi:hypothetical protein